MGDYEGSYTDSLTDGQWRSEALRHFAVDRGQFRPTQAWILTPYDTWEPNPCYVGPAQPHPESDDPPVPLSFKQASAAAAQLASAANVPVFVIRFGLGWDILVERA